MTENWKYVPFKEIFNWGKKSSIKSGEGKHSGKYKMFVCSDSDIKYYDSFLLNEEAIVFGTGGKASCHYVNEAFAYSTDCAVALPKSSEYCCKFYYYFLRQNGLEKLQSTFKGSGLQHTSKKKIEKILLPIPAKDEQERIVAKIEELYSQLDDGINTLCKIEKQLVVTRNAKLRQSFAEIADCKRESIRAVCENIVDCPHSTPRWSQEGKICLRTTNFRRGYLDLSEKNFVTEEIFNLRNVRLTPLPGDVLYSREGAILGIACIIPKDLYVCLGQRMMLLRTNSRMINKFLMYYLNSPYVTTYVAGITGGSASPHVNVCDIKNYQIPVPPISKQEKIINDIEGFMSIIYNIEKTVERSLRQTDCLKQSILHKAFNGELI